MKIQKIVKLIVKIVSKYYFLILIGAGLLTAISFPRASRLFTNINTDLASLIPDDYQSVKSINEVRDKFDTIKSLIVMIENDDTPKAKKVVGELVSYLESFEEVASVTYKKPGYDFFNKHALLFLDYDDLVTIKDRIDRKIQKEKLGSLYVDFEDEGDEKEFKFGDLESKYKSKYSTGSTSEYFTNDSETVYALYVRPSENPVDISHSEKFYKFITEKTTEFFNQNDYPDTKYHFTGSIRTHVDEYSTLIKDLKRAGIISCIGIFLILALYFRRIWSVGLLFLPLSMGIITTFAFSSFHIEHLNVVTSFLFAILGGLGVEIGIHILSRYIEERRKTKDIEEALYKVLYHTGGSALTSAATVAATFLILMVNDFKGFTEFGYIAGFGLLINYLCYIVVFPSLLVLAEKFHVLNFKRSLGFDFTKSSSCRGRFPMPRFILISLGVFAIVCIIDMPKISFEWSFSNLKAVIASAQVGKKKQRQTSQTVNSPAIVIINNKLEAEAIKDAVEEEKRNNPNTVVHAVKSYYDLVPSDQEKKMGIISEIKDLLRDNTLKLVKGEHRKDLDRFMEALERTELIKEEDIPEDIKEVFTGQHNKETEVVYINPLPKLELDDGRNAIRFAEEIQEITTPLGKFYPSSSAIVFADVLKTMISDGKRVVALAFLIVFLIVYIDFRKFSTSFMVVSPIALGVIFLAGFMYIFKLKLNFYNMAVTPTVIGTSIDNSVHVYHRYKELGKGSLMEAFKSTGGAALMSSLTNIFGFLGLIFASHNGLKSIGNLAVTGMLACLITTLVFFPALLQYLEDREVNSKS